MAAWELRRGETLLSRGPVEFATGVAAPVSGMRRFRDPERRDIQHELPGWPEGPAHALRSRADRNARSTARRAGVVSHSLVALTAGILGAVGSPFGEPRIRGKSEDPQNEVDDFPVMWFHPLPIAATAEERATLDYEFVRELFPRGDDALWAATAPYYDGMGELRS